MINRLIEPTSGTIRIDGRDIRDQSIDALRRSLGYVIQQVGLFPHLTIAENVATVPKLLGWDKTRVEARVSELLDLVGLPPATYAKRRPRELSGGQAQRVGVARALAADPPILLMDEPFAALDPINRLRLQNEMRRLQEIVKKTIVFVTHDIDEAARLGDLLVLLEHGGRVAQFGSPREILMQPASPFVKEFLGRGQMVRQLDLVPLQTLELPPLRNEAAAAGASVQLTDTLLDALNAALTSSDGRVLVLSEGRAVSALDLDQIRQLAR
jgi:osmoprotectant transport system ATP-binding protein